jgi:serine/threonine protein kinase
MAKTKNLIQPGDDFGGWTIEKHLGSGGNGDVWQATKLGYGPHAIKILRKVNDESYERFKIEIESLVKLGAHEGIVPLIDKYIPEKRNSGHAWYVMPLATPFEEYRKDKKADVITADFIKLAKVIDYLHAHKISHRDIKPTNFLYWNGTLCLSDFGLVKYPGQRNLTSERRDIGAKFTMAPEMRRHAWKADGIPADVYSFAKSLWIAITDVPLGFDGQYNQTSSISLRNYLKGFYTTKLDQLLIECTETDPNLRPNITSVISRLEEWLSLLENFSERNLVEWTELTQKLFPLGAPSRTTWTQIDAICAVLSEVAEVPALNHMFYPSGGGNTITSVSRSSEDGMIMLHIGEKIAEILKPKKLTYEHFNGDTHWNYFRLEAELIKPTGIEGALDSDGISETLTEITPGVYYPYLHWDYNDFNGQPLPETARPVTRYLKGSFVFFSTNSAYNNTSETYDARHNKMTEELFRSYIERHVTR